VPQENLMEVISSVSATPISARFHKTMASISVAFSLQLTAAFDKNRKNAWIFLKHLCIVSAFFCVKF